MAKSTNRTIAKDYKVDSLSQLIEAVEDIQSDWGGFNVWYRGHRSSNWPLTPLVHRSGRKFPERDLYCRFQASAWSKAQSLPTEDEVSHWLCLMRHYGLPTRLLDWSRSPLVAAYFALNKMPPESPTIWAMNSWILNASQGIDAEYLVLSDNTSVDQLLGQLIEIAGGEVVSVKAKSILAVIPPEIDKRMLVQQSTFTIHADSTPLEEFDCGLPFLTKIAIEPDAAQLMSSNLSTMGYKRSHLFPDLDSLAKELKHEYARQMSTEDFQRMMKTEWPKKIERRIAKRRAKKAE